MAKHGDDRTGNLVCSFCGKSQDEVRKLIAGPTVYICDECIDLCNDIIAEECDQEEGLTSTSSVPKPGEIKRVLDQYFDGVPDAAWCARVIKLLEGNEIDTLIKESTQHQMLKAGNVGGELLNWIAMLGAIGNRKPDYVAPQMQNGHAYGVWRWN